MIVKNIKEVKSYVTKTDIPSYEFAINPYVGCPHKCIYCYAEFMKRFTNHIEPWGDFIDIKMCAKPIKIDKLKGKKIILSSVTDPYNPYEKEYEITRSILEQLKNSGADLTIITKSDLVLRDLDLLKEFETIRVAFSMNTLDDVFRLGIEPYTSSVTKRLDALEKLHNAGLKTTLFMSPMFPGITDYRELMNETLSFVDEYWLENLNLRGAYKYRVLDYVYEKYPKLKPLYEEIYKKGNPSYWDALEEEIDSFCAINGISYKNYFHHGKVTQIKLEQGTC